MIRYIPNRSIVGRSKQGDFSLPSSVDTTCPFCRRKVNFAIQWNKGLNTAVNYAPSHCPACQRNVKFIQIVDETRTSPIIKGELFISPGSDIRQCLPGIDENENLQEGLKKAYTSAINVFNAQEWTATSVLCRRVLEGITKSILPAEERSKPLAIQLKELSKNIDLNKPILTLADAIRKGGNLGAHFDLEREPNEEISALMVDLLDYLVEYIFILPERIESLHDKIEKLSENSTDNAS